MPRLDIRTSSIDDPDRLLPRSARLPCSTCSAWVELNIGVTGQPGADIFAVHVARCDTGEWRLSVALLEQHFHHEFQDYDEVPSKLPVVPMIKACHAAGVHLPTWEPLADNLVYLEVRLTVGVRKQPDDREYVVTIATPAGLRANRSGFVLANHAVLLISEYHWDAIAAELGEIVARCRGSDWAHCRRKLDRMLGSN